jgi:hypothetical protein
VRGVTALQLPPKKPESQKKSPIPVLGEFKDEGAASARCHSVAASLRFRFYPKPLTLDPSSVLVHLQEKLRDHAVATSLVCVCVCVCSRVNPYFRPNPSLGGTARHHGVAASLGLS